MLISPGLLFIIFCCCFSTLVLLSYLFVKIRNLHLQIYQLADSVQDVGEIKIQGFLKQLQCLDTLYSRLELDKGTLSPAWGWTALPDLLCFLQEEAAKKEVKTIVECGSGLSTAVIASTLAKKGFGHVYSFEHDKNCAASSKRELEKLGLTKFATIIESPLAEIQVGQKEVYWYNIKDLPFDSCDLLFIDGPPVNSTKLARHPALPFFEKSLSKNACVILDDGIRADEQEIAKLWLNKYPNFKTEPNLTERQAIILRKICTQ